MKTKLLIAVIAVLALSGCATRTGTAIVAGTAGLIIGNSMAQSRTVIVYDAPVIHYNCAHFYTHSERVACERGARQRYNEEQHRRDNEAFRRGYGR